MTIELDIKHKKKVLAFRKQCRQFDRDQKIPIKVTVSWTEQYEYVMKPEVEDDFFGDWTITKLLDESPKLKKLNKDLKKYVKEVEAYGLKHFDNEHWFWDNNVDYDKIKWIKDKK